MGDLRVLVMLSTYNGEKYLKAQLDSLRNQTNVNLCVLVRDDASKDRTLEILEQYKSLMNLAYEAAENVGSTRSFMELIRNCSSEYDFYAFCDQDDYWHADKLSTAIVGLENLDIKKPSLYYSGQKLVDSNLSPIYDHTLDTYRNEYANAIFNQMAGCTTVFNKTLLLLLKQYQNVLNVPGFHDSFTYRVCVLAGGEFICDSEGQIDYRQHGSNIVGLDYSLKGKLNKVLRYIRPSELKQDLDYIFDQDLKWCDMERVVFFNHVRLSNHSIKSKLWLLVHQGRIDFHSPVLRVIYNFKILSSQL